MKGKKQLLSLVVSALAFAGMAITPTGRLRSMS